MEKKLYHVLTPVPPESLRLVNCLLLGNVAIPNCVLVGQVGAAGRRGRLAGLGPPGAIPDFLFPCPVRARSCLGISRWLSLLGVVLSAQNGGEESVPLVFRMPERGWFGCSLLLSLGRGSMLPFR